MILGPKTKKKVDSENLENVESQSLVHFSKMLTWILRHHNFRFYRGITHLYAKQKSKGIGSLVQNLGKVEGEKRSDPPPRSGLSITGFM